MCVILTGKGAGFLEPSWAAWEPPDLPMCVCGMPLKTWVWVHRVGSLDSKVKREEKGASL